jgi:E3 ubiquitin-protein ligase synoviolin
MPVVGALLRERLQPFVDSHRVLLYVVFSILALAITTFNALRDHSNFFSVAIHLAKSSRSLLVRSSLQTQQNHLANVPVLQVLANSGMCTAFISGRILQSVFFGPLLPAEVEVCAVPHIGSSVFNSRYLAFVRPNLVLHHGVSPRVYYLSG